MCWLYAGVEVIVALRIVTASLMLFEPAVPGSFVRVVLPMAAKAAGLTAPLEFSDGPCQKLVQEALSTCQHALQSVSSAISDGVLSTFLGVLCVIGVRYVQEHTERPIFVPRVMPADDNLYLLMQIRELLLRCIEMHPQHELTGMMTLVIIMLATLVGTTPFIDSKTSWETAAFLTGDQSLAGSLACMKYQRSNSFDYADCLKQSQSWHSGHLLTNFVMLPSRTCTAVLASCSVKRAWNQSVTGSLACMTHQRSNSFDCADCLKSSPCSHSQHLLTRHVMLPSCMCTAVLASCSVQRASRPTEPTVASVHVACRTRDC